MLEYQRQLFDEKMRPFPFGLSEAGDGSAGAKLRTAGLLFSLFGFTACLACLYHCMRALLRVGGMVASGGPYAIAHPAPGWAWLVPGSILGGAFFVMLNQGIIRRAGGLSLLAFIFPATFLPLGWNFLEFSFPPRSSGNPPVWGWLVSGIAFVITGIIPGYFFFKGLVRSLSGGDGAERYRAVDIDGGGGGGAWKGLILLQLVFLALGVLAGGLLFRAISGS